ncbi:hypothetical protein [Anaerovorax odorimutans]|uniref:hypothetical protein n=1 Tax=Anaerovorax odorimutans TaxID=109327 RepID=UPI000418CBAE|nr:hypothetical protein [Anaerovorax odorimutans]
MIKIAHIEETENLRLSDEVTKVIKEEATILDNEYGIDRDVDGKDGGYILVIESEDDFKRLKDIDINIDTVIVEDIIKIKTENEEDWLNCLILFNNDFGISLIMPFKIAPNNLINEIVNY